MRIGSLCTGYGGLDAAAQAVLGGKLVFVADNDPGATAILAHHFPSVPNLGDITGIGWSSVEPVDLLAAGFPCQDVSCAGARKGLRAGNRTGVWAYVAEAIAALRPPLVLLENVRGLLTFGADSNLEPCPWCMGDSGDESVLRACGAVLADLADLGFDAEWQLVSAAAVGAPHRRERVFILAWPAADTDRPARGERRIAAPGQEESRRARADAGRRGGAPAADAERDGRPGRPAGLAGTPDEPGEGSRAAVAGRGPVTAADTSGAGLEVRAVEPDRHERQAPQRGRGNDPAADADRADPGPYAGGSGEAAPAGPVDGPERRGEPGPGLGGDALDWGQYELAIRRWEHITGRPAPRPTEPGRTGERLAPRFVEWMMGLPAGWVTDVPGPSRNAQLKALGNGVVPQQAAMALSLLLERSGLRSLIGSDEMPAEGGEAA